ncbi:heavy-metal-associated domain-containing protein [Haloglycomyces albus]|uniref:heavy-metal-associated domain-containing protein n=1 Tax=Haloglycomyces albus TaxID=526067 RepID=UPI0004BAF3AC|nr:cation transporter [Haloglycomyces albus]
MQSTYKVEGMSCQHCVNSVTDELKGVSGVTGVDVNLESGTVTVASDAELALDKVREAVDEAGYELTGKVAAELNDTKEGGGCGCC